MSGWDNDEKTQCVNHDRSREKERGKEAAETYGTVLMSSDDDLSVTLAVLSLLVAGADASTVGGGSRNTENDGVLAPRVWEFADLDVELLVLACNLLSSQVIDLSALVQQTVPNARSLERPPIRLTCAER